MESKYVDNYGNPLRDDGIYFTGDGLDGDLYHIMVESEGGSFSADYWQGKLSIEDHKLFASNLIPLANPLQNIMFAASKLEGSLIE